MRKHFFSFLKIFKNKWVIAIIVVALIILAYVFTHRGNNQTIESAVATMGNVIEKVSVTGKVSPMDKANLAFEKGGVISMIAVKVGDRVVKGDLIASLNSADDAAALESEQATLADMSRPLTPEELSVQKVALDGANRDAMNAAHDSFIKAEDAVFNYADTFFTNPQSANPIINIRTQSSIQQNSLNNQRIGVTDMLNSWSKELSSISDPATLIDRSRAHLLDIKSFLNSLAIPVNDLNVANSGLSQSFITADVTAMNSGLSSINTAIDSVTSSRSALSSAKSNYDLKLSGNSAQSIAAQAAKVAQARAQLAKNSLVSPIDGLVTLADPHLGEFIAAGQSGFAVQSYGALKIEAYVPEADIAKVALNDHAAVTLDAYGSDAYFPATVTAIDPAETVLEGVPTYKVTLVFSAPDARIRSGMTANTDILTHEADNVLTVPIRAIVDDNGDKSVRVLNADGKTFTTIPVAVGLKGSDGMIEVKSGLTEGDKVVTYVK